uniref:FCP1 homology domain-containing protein n=1 Tax=Zooxanthella nutricula TaxID=1333877 RepID=A0A6U6WEF8_9DINO
MGSDEERKKRRRLGPAAAEGAAKPASPSDPFGGGGGGGLYDFLPPPDPSKDAAATAAAERQQFSRPKLPPEDRSRVIFLDVDGVLLPTGSIETIIVDGVALPARTAVQESDFGTSALGNLRSIVQQTGATIVLSSEWRRTEALRSSIGTVLRSQDIPLLRDCTPIFSARPELQKHDPIVAWCERRSREIGKWLKDHPEVSAWVALDDLDFAWADAVRLAGTPWMKHRSVHTNDKICLTEEGVTRAVDLLRNPPPEPKPAPRKVSSGRAATSELLCSTEDSMPERIRLG